jgi:hypothetical protein
VSESRWRRCRGTELVSLVADADEGLAVEPGAWCRCRCRPNTRVRPGVSWTVCVDCAVSRGGEEDNAVRRGEEECATVDVEGVINRIGSAGTLNKASEPVEVLRGGVVARARKAT